MAPSRSVRCATRASSVPRSGGSSRPIGTCGRATHRWVGARNAVARSQRGASPVGTERASVATLVRVSRQADPDLADVRIRVRRVDRKPVPERCQAEAVPDSQVNAETEHEPDAGFAGAAEAARIRADRAEPQATGEKEAACGARVVAHPSVQRADGEGRTILRLSPAGRPDAEQELGSQRSAEREPATQSTGTPAAALAPERAVPKADVEPEALASLGMLG